MMLQQLLFALKQVFMFFVPCFCTDYVCGRLSESGQFEPECSLDFWVGYDLPEVVVKVKVLTWLSFCWPITKGKVVDRDEQLRRVGLL